ncbi:signal recognition particle-docking protein FtsY [Anaerovirgula multivorans]|uniref:Signal recognition particle receptor FtsY n=1 Tax=Anaerovirgula multivorans TaxID=312168 RepID=A0A239A4L4_9FIRM|nr:signal recognition particle-docking protein FtsY [Anaerovirgula multivorans]SNR90231.1 signal recognition particle-docking protein FtsY [Anaerovirgula multivorans]
MLKKIWDKLLNKNEKPDEVEEKKQENQGGNEEENPERLELEEDMDLLDTNKVEENEHLAEEEELEVEEIPEDFEANEESFLQEIDEDEEIEVDVEMTAIEEEEIEEQVVDEATEKVSLFKRLKEGLSKTKKGITDKIDVLIKSYQKIDEELFEELEEILIGADIGVSTTMEVIEELKDTVKERKLVEPQEIKEILQEKLTIILNELSFTALNVEPSPSIILVVGVNGVGKTTSIGKIAHKLKKQGKKVVLAAGDTFRAAAIDQLKIWGDRVGVDVIKHQEGSDPAAVVYDAIQAAKARNVDVLICDTAGRLHNKKNLMNELGKVFKVVEREFPEASKEVLLVLDATTGQNAIQQAKTFKEVANISGLVLTKLDGTAKGGIVIAISKELNIPVKLIGVGEKMEDLQEFHSNTFVKALFGEE